jgi:hypothetical protein
VTVGEQSAADSPLMNMDPEKPQMVSAWGSRGSGKSALNRELFRSYPFDKIVVDVNGNADPGEDAEKITAPLPTRFPDAAAMLGTTRRARTLWFRAHPGDKSYREHLDQAVGLALYPQHRRVCLWAGEVGELQPHGRPGPHMRTALMQNRHYNVTCLFDGPRPMNVDPLTLAQSHFVAVFHLPNPRDRDRIADSIGFPPKRFTEACHAAWRLDEHAFVLWDANRKRLYEHEPLPLGDDAKAPA